MSTIPPTLAFHLAKAYGVQAPRPLSVRAIPEGAARTEPIARIDRARPTDRVDTTRLGTGAARLVSAKVNVPAFEGVSATPGRRAETFKGDALPFYHHPADRNAAATGVDLGRSVDISG